MTTPAPKTRLMPLLLLGGSAVLFLIYLEPILQTISGNNQIQVVEEALHAPQAGNAELKVVGPEGMNAGATPIEGNAGEQEGAQAQETAGQISAVSPSTPPEPEMPFTGSLLTPKDIAVAERAWMALERLDRWKGNALQPSALALRTYMQHPKVWVRLEALQAALIRKIFTENQLQEVANDIRTRNNAAQIKRWLQRPRNSQPAVYETMSAMLGLK